MAIHAEPFTVSSQMNSFELPINLLHSHSGRICLSEDMWVGPRKCIKKAMGARIDVTNKSTKRQQNLRGRIPRPRGNLF